MTRVRDDGVPEKAINGLRSIQPFRPGRNESRRREDGAPRNCEKYGSSDEVKSFGERMATDHKAAGDKLKALADQKGITLLDGLPKDVEKDEISLGKKKGKDFDKAYMAMMVKDHEADVKDFQKEADKGQDPDVKSYASSTLPTLQDHLNQAKGSKSDVKKEQNNKSYSEPK